MCLLFHLITHTQTHTHSVRLPLDKKSADRRSLYPHGTQSSRETKQAMPPAVEQLAIPAKERLQTHAQNLMNSARRDN